MKYSKNMTKISPEASAGVLALCGFPVLRGQHAATAFKCCGELALAVVSDPAGDFGNRKASLQEKPDCLFHAVFLHVRSEGITVYRLENRLQRGGVHMKLAGKCLDGDLFIQMQQQVFMDVVDQSNLVGPEIRQQLRFFRAGDLHRLLDHMVQQLRGFSFAGAVIHFLPFAPARD